MIDKLLEVTTNDLINKAAPVSIRYTVSVPNGYLESVLDRYSIALEVLNTNSNLMKKFRKKVEKRPISQPDNHPPLRIVTNDNYSRTYL